MTRTRESKKPDRLDAKRRAGQAGRRFLTENPQGAADTLMIDMAHAAERATPTITNWWIAYAVFAHLHHSLHKATLAERLAFCDWLETAAAVPQHRLKSDAPRPRSTAAQQRQAQRNEQRIHALLDRQAEKYGREHLLPCLMTWLQRPAPEC